MNNPQIVLIKPLTPRNTMGTASPWDIPSLSLGYLAAYLEKKKIPVQIIDADILKLTWVELKQRLIELNSPLVGLTCNAYTAKFACLTALFIRRDFPNIKIIFGGPYATTMYDFLLRKNFADYVVMGEGEITLYELINAFRKNDEFKEVLGIAFKDSKGNIITTPPRPLIEDLNSLPFPAWHLFPNLKRYKNLRGVLHRPYLPIITTRGCPFGCIWCFKDIHGHKIRERGVQNIIDEMKFFVEKYGVKEFVVMDDNFTLNRKKAIKICQEIIKNNLNLSINLYTGIRADTVNETLLTLLKQVGCHRITVGIESGNQKIQKLIKKNLDLKVAEKTIQMVKKAGMVIDCLFMLGLPYDTPKTLNETIQFALKNNPHHAYFFITIPIPGTPLFDLVKSNYKLKGSFELGIFHHIVEGKAIFETPHFTRKYIEKIFRKAYTQFYFRPKKLISLLILYLRFILQYRSISELRWLISQFLFFLK